MQSDSLLAFQERDLPGGNRRNGEPVLAGCKVDRLRRLPSQTRFVQRCPEQDMRVEEQQSSRRAGRFCTHFMDSHSTSMGEIMSPRISPVPCIEPTKSPSC